MLGDRELGLCLEQVGEHDPRPLLDLAPDRLDLLVADGRVDEVRQLLDVLCEQREVEKNAALDEYLAAVGELDPRAVTAA